MIQPDYELTQKLRYQKTYGIFEELDLPLTILEHVMVTNTASHAPYHNNQHLLTVANNAYEGGYNYKLDKDNLIVLFLAGLYHDYNHSIGKHKDHINVLKSASGFVESVETINHKITNDQVNRISRLILATEFPHQEITVNEEDKINKWILRDSDILQTISPDEYFFEAGLFEETGIRQSTKQKISFIQNHVKTTWARNKIDEYARNKGISML